MTETVSGLKAESVPMSRRVTSDRLYDDSRCSAFVSQGEFNDSAANPLIRFEQSANDSNAYDVENWKVSPFRPTPSALHRMDTTADSTIDFDGNDDSVSVVSRLSYSRRRRRRDLAGGQDAAKEEQQRQELEKALRSLEEMQRENKERMRRTSSMIFSTDSADATGRRMPYDDQTPEQYFRTQSVGVHLTREALRLQMFERAATSLAVPEPLMEAINSSRKQRCKGRSSKITSPKAKRNGLWMAPSNKRVSESPAVQSQCVAPDNISVCMSAESLSVKKDVNAGKNLSSTLNALSTSKDLSTEQQGDNGRTTKMKGAVRAHNGGNRGVNSSVSPTSSRDEQHDPFVSSSGEVRAAKRTTNNVKKVAGGPRPSSGRPSGRSSSPPVIILTVDTRRHMGEEDARRLLSAKPLEGYESHAHLRPSVDSSMLSNLTARRAVAHTLRAVEPFTALPSTVIAEGECKGKFTPPETRRSPHANEVQGPPVSTAAAPSVGHVDAPSTQDEGCRKSGSVQLSTPATQQTPSKVQSTSTAVASPQTEKKKRAPLSGLVSRSQQAAKLRTGKPLGTTLKSPVGTAAESKTKMTRSHMQAVAGTARVERRSAVVHRSSFPKAGVEAFTQQRTMAVVRNSEEPISPPYHEEAPLSTYGKDGRRVKQPPNKPAQASATVPANTTTVASSTTATSVTAAATTAAAAVSVVNAVTTAAVVAVANVRQRPTFGRLALRRKSLTSLPHTSSVERASVRPLATDRPQTNSLNTVRCAGSGQQPAAKQLVPFCTECGKRHLDEKVKFCAFCGHKRELA